MHRTVVGITDNETLKWHKGLRPVDESTTCGWFVQDPADSGTAVSLPKEHRGVISAEVERIWIEGGPPDAQ
jgi:hypothetical protein